MYASHFNWLQVSFRRTSLSSTGFESRKGERFPRAQGRRYLPVSASILLYFESLILNPTLRCVHLSIPGASSIRPKSQCACGKTTTRGGGNTTGVSFLFSDLVSKHLGLLRELLPRAARIGLLVNPQNANADHLAKNATAAAASTGTEITVLRASHTGAIDEA